MSDPAVLENVSQQVPNPVSDVQAPAISQESQAPASTQSTTQEAQTPAIPAEIAALAEQIGFAPEQFAGFTDVASAEAAVDLWLNNESKRGAELITKPGHNVSVGGSASLANTEEVAYTPFDLDALGLSETDAAAKAIKKLEQDAIKSRQELNQVLAQAKAAELQSVEQQRESVFNEAQKLVGDWQSPTFGIPGKNQTLLQLAAQEKLYQLAREYEVADINEGRAITPLAIRLNRARFKLGDRPKKGPALKPVNVIPTGRSNESAPTGAGGSYSGAWSRDPAVASALRNL